MIPVHHYGLHFADGAVGFLLQSGEPQAIHPVDSPFYVAKHTGRCPHRVDIDERDTTHTHLLEDPLARWMATPRGVAVIDGVHHSGLVEKLTQLYSPTRSLLSIAWGYRSVWRQELRCTNFCPWILVDGSVGQVDLLRAAEQYPRPLLVLARSVMPAPGGVRLTTDLTEADLPDPNALRRLGAWAAYERLKKP